METKREMTVLLTGATGFVGQTLYPALVARGHQVRCASRNAVRARERWPDRRWVEMDVDEAASVHRALQGCDAAYYLVHRMADVGEFEQEETRAAMTFVDAATEAGVQRMVYLGGVRPAGEPATHLRSRLVTGSILRSSPVSTIELRASMIIGPGSASWQILRDLALRLPVMLCPRWLKNRTEPVAIEDATQALVEALTLEVEGSHYFGVPGPESLTFRECIERVCDIVGNRPRLVDVPVLSPRLSSYWLRLVTGVNYHIARALAEGLKDDLLADNDDYWTRIGHRDRVGFDEAVRRTLAAENNQLNSYERVVHTLTARHR